MYKRTDTDAVIRLADDAYIPADKSNSGYANYLDWLKEGNEPEAADAPQPPSIQSQIDTLETASKIPRVTREFMLAVMEKEATDAGVTQADLYAANVGYRKLKDLDAQIRALRALL